MNLVLEYDFYLKIVCSSFKGKTKKIKKFLKSKTFWFLNLDGNALLRMRYEIMMLHLYYDIYMALNKNIAGLLTINFCVQILSSGF